jgi:four helix bundle protein
MGMTTIQRFEDLWVWQQARVLVSQVYGDFRVGAGATDFAFCDQIHRAALSTMSNVAEGFERSSNPERARFVEIAKGSCGEVRSLYYAGVDLGYVALPCAEERWALGKQLSAGLASLAEHLRDSKATRRRS